MRERCPRGSIPQALPGQGGKARVESGRTEIIRTLRGVRKGSPVWKDLPSLIRGAEGHLGPVNGVRGKWPDHPSGVKKLGKRMVSGVGKMLPFFEESAWPTFKSG